MGCSGWRWTQQPARKEPWCPLVPFLHFLLFNPALCHGTRWHAGAVSVPGPLGRRMRDHTLRCGLSPCSTGLEQPPLLRSSPGCALACLGVQVISVQFLLNGAAFLQMSSVSEATTLQLKSKSQLSHLNSFKYYFFPPIWWRFDLLSIDLLPDQTLQV